MLVRKSSAKDKKRKAPSGRLPVQFQTRATRRKQHRRRRGNGEKCCSSQTSKVSARANRPVDPTVHELPVEIGLPAKYHLLRSVRPPAPKAKRTRSGKRGRPREGTIAGPRNKLVDERLSPKAHG